MHLLPLLGVVVIMYCIFISFYSFVVDVFVLDACLRNISISCEQFKSGLKYWLFVQAYS